MELEELSFSPAELIAGVVRLFAERAERKGIELVYRVDDALSRRTQGSGLGLYLAKAIVDAHRGRIWVESTPDQGSAFTFALPRE